MRYPGGMPSIRRLVPIALALLAMGAPARGDGERRAKEAPPAWGKTLEEGLAAAKGSGRAVLVVTLWKTGV